jgi:hypothetical protein
LMRPGTPTSKETFQRSVRLFAETNGKSCVSRRGLHHWRSIQAESAALVILTLKISPTCFGSPSKMTILFARLRPLTVQDWSDSVLRKESRYPAQRTVRSDVAQTGQSH